jgi:hypothetical protein
MNERIKQLFKRAGGKTSIHNLMSNPMQQREYNELWNENIQKFAELIIEQCISKVSEWDMGIDDPVGATDNTSEVARDMVAEIKQHFGVE